MRRVLFLSLVLSVGCDTRAGLFFPGDFDGVWRTEIIGRKILGAVEDLFDRVRLSRRHGGLFNMSLHQRSSVTSFVPEPSYS